MVGAVPMSGLVAEVPDPRAVIVAIHGGGTSAAYFDCPGHPRLSLLRSAASHGFTAIALDRPGYGASALYQDEQMAVDDRGSDVLGVELAGTGLNLHAGAKTVLSQVTTTRPPDGLRDLLWQPTNLYPAEVLTGGLSAPRAAYPRLTPSRTSRRCSRPRPASWSTRWRAAGTISASA
jgi:hypothetical protein